MKKNKQLFMILALVVGFLIIGTILYQSVENSYKNQNNVLSFILEDFLQSDISVNKEYHHSKQKTKEFDTAVDNSNNSELYAFINKTIARYPLLKQIGEKMGLTKKDVANTMKNIGDNTALKSYISFFNRILEIYS